MIQLHTDLIGVVVVATLFALTFFVGGHLGRWLERRSIARAVAEVQADAAALRPHRSSRTVREAREADRG